MLKEFKKQVEKRAFGKLLISVLFPTMSKSPKQLPNCLKRADRSVFPIGFLWCLTVLCKVCTYTVSYHHSRWIRYQKKYILVKNHINNKDLSCQCNLTAQIKLEKVDLVITDTPAFQILVHSIVLKFEKIWLSGTLNIMRKPRKSLFSKRKRAITSER
jgi:hypothetical protein